MADAQAAIDAFRLEYNTNRPHQSLGMDFPADRFTPRPVDELGLSLPPRLANHAEPTNPPIVDAAVALPPAPALVMSSSGIEPVNRAVEIDRMVPASGNLAVCGQQFWLGPTMGGVTLTLWANTSIVHLVRDGTRIKTVPSRLTDTHLRQLLADGGRPAGPPPAAPGPVGPIEVDRLVNACGQVGLVGVQHPIGYHLAGRRVTVRLDRGVMQILDQQRTQGNRNSVTRCKSAMYRFSCPLAVRRSCRVRLGLAAAFTNQALNGMATSSIVGVSGHPHRRPCQRTSHRDEYCCPCAPRT